MPDWLKELRLAAAKLNELCAAPGFSREPEPGFELAPSWLLAASEQVEKVNAAWRSQFSVGRGDLPKPRDWRKRG